MADYLSINHLILSCWKLIKSLREHPEVLNLQSHFATLCANHGACGFNEVAKVKESYKLIQFFLPEFVDAHEELDPAAAILDVSKRKLAHVADGAQATSERQLEPLWLASSFACFECLDGIGIVAIFI